MSESSEARQSIEQSGESESESIEIEPVDNNPHDLEMHYDPIFSVAIVFGTLAAAAASGHIARNRKRPDR
jgi:hypothetical protein